MFALGLAIWLILLTIIIFLLIIAFVCIVKKNKKEPEVKFSEKMETGYGSKPGNRESFAPQPVERANSLYTTKHMAESEPNSPTSPTGVNPVWMDTLKTETESRISIQTIEDDNPSRAGSRTDLTQDNVDGKKEIKNDINADAVSVDSHFSTPEMVY